MTKDEIDKARKSLSELAKSRLTLVGSDHVADARVDGASTRRITREQLEADFPGRSIVAEREHYAWSPYDKLKMRLNVQPGEAFGQGVHVNIFTGPNRAFVFVGKDDKAVILEDDVYLFPSDSLIGQFQLFLESVL